MAVQTSAAEAEKVAAVLRNHHAADLRV
jgi:hypothetical protein